RVNARLDKMDTDAQGLGFPRVLDKKQVKRIGVGQIAPSATEIIDLMLKDGKQYRLFSAVAHGHMWAIYQLGFMQSTTSPNPAVGNVVMHGLEKSINPHVMGILS